MHILTEIGYWFFNLTALMPYYHAPAGGNLTSLNILKVLHVCPVKVKTYI